ncbi:MAG TPA: phosphomethylpyrimidine synthase ThiC [Clostridia bacterium]|nr:phosphomethylpyrimidine synthase ThiC [Clostridia bacterium]
MTQVLSARKGIITPEIKKVADLEKRDPEFVRAGVASGSIVIPANVNHINLKPLGFGNGLSTKVNANIGTSDRFPEIEKELEKLKAALKAGADAVMDLSTGGDINECRRTIIRECHVPVGTVPIYQAAVEARERHDNIVNMDVDELFEAIESQCKEGVDFITVHCGVTLNVIDALRKQGRVTSIVSRGGALLAGWMIYNEQENPLYSQYDRLLEIALRYDVTLSLGDGLRPGCIADATDRAQIQELLVLGELVDRARELGVQVMVEGPGHVPLDQVVANVQAQKSLCKDAPFYVLGPLVTDIAPGYDHIVSAIGGAIAASAGADFLCYVTPAEHLGLPTVEDVFDGVIASKIAAHAADIVKKVPGAFNWDLEMSKARHDLDWQRQIELAIDPDKARSYREEYNPSETEGCSMCGELCALKIVSKHFGGQQTGCE